MNNFFLKTICLTGCLSLVCFFPVTNAVSPTVSSFLVANPNSLSFGESALLTWSSEGAFGCTGVGFSTGGRSQGSVIVTPKISTTYGLSCTNGVENTVVGTLVAVNDILSVSCSGLPNPGTVFSPVTWSASVSGGTGEYTYAWAGSDGLSGTAPSLSRSYNSTGIKKGVLVVTSGDFSVRTACDGTLCQESSCECFGDQCGVPIEEGDRVDLAARAPVLGSGLNVAGSDVSFQGLITNNGNQSVRSVFQNRFQVDIGGDGTYDLTLDTPKELHTVPLRGLETVMSPLWKNIPTGTHFVRFCADVPPYPNGFLSEVRENNNCSQALVFAVSGSNSRPLIRVEPQVVKKGGTVVVSWVADSVDSCFVSGPGVAATGLTGSLFSKVNENATFTITCKRDGSIYKSSTDVRLTSGFEER